MGCNLVATQPCFQSSVVHAGRERNAVYDNRLALVVETRTGEWVKRILNRHANARGTYPKRVSCIREYVRDKRSRRLRAVPERAHVLKVSKELQILVANFV